MQDRKKYVDRKKLEYEAQRRIAEADELARRRLRQFSESKAARSVAGNVAGGAGAVVGVGRGIYHDAKAIKDGAVFAYDLADSGSRDHDAAVATGRRVIKDAADYVATRAADPSLAWGDFKRAGAQMNRDVNPDATPAASTLTEEIARRYGIGKNQGELAYNVASLALPIAGEVKGAAQLGRFAKAGPAKYIARGASPQLAEYLAQPYEGMGSHLVPRRTRLPGGAPIPEKIMDSRFNVLKPKAIERGAMYERHFGVDDRYWGGKVPAAFGGGGWSGRRLGWKKYNPVERIWYGTPGVTKAAVIGGPASLGALGGATADKRRR
jgi:hypothetical protein